MSRDASATEVNNLRREIMAYAQQQGGPISQHYKDVKHLKPEVAQIDALEFTCDVTAAGVVSNPPKQSVPGGFLAQLTEIRGYMQAPLVDPELSGAIYFNVKDQQRSGDMFSTAVMMGHLVDTSGGGQPMDMVNGLYVFDPGSDIQVKFTTDGDSTLGYANLAGAAKRWSILLRFNLFAI